MEINQNSILKLIVRQGTDLDRNKVILTSGELGYTTDTRRLFVGNSVLSGGDVVGNISHDTNTTITGNYPTAIKGDIAFSSDLSKLYRFKGTNANDLSSWEVIGGVYTSGDSYITISTDNEITLGLLSANSVSSDLIKFPLILDSGKIALSSKIPFQTVSNNTITFGYGLSATINGINQTNIPINSLSANIVLTTTPFQAISSNMVSSDLVKFPIILDSGKIALSSNIPTYFVSTKTITISSGLKATSNGLNVTNSSMNLLDSNLLVESNQILAMYDGNTSTLSYSRNLSSTPVIKLSAGHYRFFFDDLFTSNLYPISNIFGGTPIGCSSRPISITSTSCDIQIMSASGPAITDGIVTLSISY